MKRQIISKWKRKPQGTFTDLQQVVYHTQEGKKSNGKPRIVSRTKHEPITTKEPS